LIAFSVIFFVGTAYSVTINNPLPSRADSARQEINVILFSGDVSFKDNELLKVISSRPTDLSLPHRGVRYIYEQLMMYPYKSYYYLDNLEYSLQNWASEFSFFNLNQVELDSAILYKYYNIKGFHDFKCSVYFYSDSSDNLNVLEFKMNAGRRCRFADIVYRGLESVPEEITKNINKVRELKKGDFFDETKLYLELERVKQILRESGYYFADYTRDFPIQIDEEKYENTVVVLFQTGIRQKINKIHFIDSLSNQAVVSMKMKKSLLDFKEGDYYSPTKISRSELNLYSLGTFEIVKIDTAKNRQSYSDSLLDMDIILGYRKQHSYGAGFFFNQTTWDQAYNVGIEGDYSNKNIFGAAQLFNPYVKFTILDVNRAIQNWPIFEYELSIGIVFSQPMLWNFPGLKVGLTAQPSYSYRIFNKFLNLETWSLPFNFSTKLPDFTFFQHFNLNFTFERQNPTNFDQAMNDLLAELENGTAQDTINLLETFTLYDNLNTYIKTYDPILTANLIGGSFSGDTRDNPFSPTRGYLTNVSIEGLNPIFLPFDNLSGAAKFARAQIMYLLFKPLSRSSVFGLKIKAGYIFWWDKQVTYVPSDRQFYAGGANSVRGWGSRKLRYYNPEQFTTDLINTTATNYATDYVGNTTLIESSFEYRFRFTDIIRGENLMAEQLSSFGAVAFVDIGNAYQWMIVDSLGNYHFTYTFDDYFKNLAVAIGFGLRYETPVGPIRIDFGWPFFDPMRKEDKFLFQRRSGFDNMILHIGLGHSF